MTQTLDELFTAQNQALFNMLFRHQVYLEGFKASLSQNYQAYLRKLYGEFAIYLKQTRYQSMDQFTKAQLLDFVRKFTIAQGKFYSSFTASLINALQQFLAIDVNIHKDIMEAVTGRTIIEANTPLKNQLTQAQYAALSPAVQADYQAIAFAPDESDPGDDIAVWSLTAQGREVYEHNKQASGIYGYAAVDGTPDADEQLWANIVNSPLPANGGMMLAMIDDYGKTMSNKMSQTVFKGYANSWTVDQLQDELLGKNIDFTGGVFNTFLLQYRALLATVVQHVSTEAQSAVASVYLEQYQWVAIMDNKTTIICQSRNGVVYVYGVGPLPPAHWFCRSKAVGVASDTHLHDIPDTYYDWLLTQPEPFLSDILGESRAKALLAGDLSPDSFAISLTKPLTLTEFQGKVKYILGDF